MATVFIGVGSNVEADINIPCALRLLSRGCKLTGISTLYETQPVGCGDAAPFTNGVVQVETDFPPREFKFEVLRGIEEHLGRKRTSDSCEPRTIDLDILLYDDLVLSESGLEIPDKHIYDRAFVAAPILELWSDAVLPGSGLTLREVVLQLDETGMTALCDLTRALRTEFEL
jgi:2-amino-4-hydroxy-6-hydroxymethyldihydropteridine diphosphokinase